MTPCTSALRDTRAQAGCRSAGMPPIVFLSSVRVVSRQVGIHLPANALLCTLTGVALAAATAPTNVKADTTTAEDPEATL